MRTHICTSFLVVLLLALPVIMKAQPMGTRADMVNKTWRIMAIKCPEQYTTANEDDQFIKYYQSLKLTPSPGYGGNNYGTYVRIHRDARDNPREAGTYQFNAAQDGATLLTLKPRKGQQVEYRIAFSNPNYLTLVNTNQNEKCKVSYAVAP
jgi:hypothetical protein